MAPRVRHPRCPRRTRLSRTGMPAVRHDCARRAAADALPILARVETRARARPLAWSTAIFSLATGAVAGPRSACARSSRATSSALSARSTRSRWRSSSRTRSARSSPTRLCPGRSCRSSASCSSAASGRARGASRRACSGWCFLGLSAITALFILAAPWVMAAFGYGSLATGLARVLFPIVVLLGVFGVIVGILNSYDQFTVPALTPVFWNVAIIVGLVIGVPRADGTDAKLYVYAGSDPARHADPAAAAAPVAARARRPPARRHRLARSRWSVRPSS